MRDQLSHKLAVNDRLTRFFEAFDDRNWSLLRDCLCDEVVADYSSFRGVAASTISRERYVEQRRSALDTLVMQHNCLNLRVDVDAAARTATARCNYVILRFRPSLDAVNDDYFHSCGHYRFTLANVDGTWRIAGITQYHLRSHGNPDIHSGAGARGDRATSDQRQTG